MFVNQHLKRKGGRLSELTTHCVQIRKIDTLLRSILPPPLKNHVKVANYANGTLVLHADSADWRTRLHWQQPASLSGLRREAGLQGLQALEIKTRPHDTMDAQTAPAVQRTLPTPACARFLRDFARHGTQDPRIRRSLERIAEVIEHDDYDRRARENSFSSDD
ncbi:MAG: DUF721 domain-containing protein [Gammaproteobacteria bacterium]|nr:DUF721 domain-containing protein [Gammaproteobacteria bacterium]